ncbi:MAG: glycosyltransferase [Acidobacteriota bacterium]
MSPPPPAPSSGSPPPAVTVAIVTHNDADDFADCFAAVARLDHRPLRVVVVDCASGDGSPESARRESARLIAAGLAFELEALPDNRGFAGGMNRILSLSDDPWVLSLNADARPRAGYLTRLLARALRHPEWPVGAVTGRLVRPVGARPAEQCLDACGMRLTKTWRHLDRGSGAVDRGQWRQADRVFGATGAASLWRREALDDVAIDGEVFDRRFHSFREDAELCFRLRERRWEVLYEPEAEAEHRRWNLPERRRQMPPVVNLHSVKNRYLLRCYHQTRRNFWRTLPAALARDIGAFGWILLRERTSLGAYGWLWRHRREILARRRVIQERRTLPAAELDRWFGVPGLPLAEVDSGDAP